MDNLNRRHLILYPDRRWVSEAWVIGQAIDHLATEYIAKNPGADDAAIQENSRVRWYDDAREILSDAGLVTFAAEEGDK
jgi:hypothetical protein